MESFRVRTLSGSSEGAYEIESRMELHERSHEHTNHLSSYDNSGNGDVLGSRYSQSAEDSHEQTLRKKTTKEFSYLYTYLSTILYAALLILESIFHFKLFERSQSCISLYWLESCVIALFFRFWGRKRIRSFRSQASHFLPFLFLHIAFVTTFGLDLDQETFGSSGGSEAFSVSLALTAPLVLLASWLTNRQSYPDMVIIMITVSCSLLLVLFCSVQDGIADYQVRFIDGVFGLTMAASLAFFTVHGKNSLPKATRAELLYLLNFTSVVCLPFLALLFGELPLLRDEFFKRGAVNVLLSVFVLAVLRLASQAACLYQLTYSTPLLNATTRGFSWIWITIGITVLTHVDSGELLVAVFLAFWIYGICTFLPILCSDLHWI